MEYSPPVQPSCSLFVVMRHSCDSNSPSKCGSELRTQNGPELGREHHHCALSEQRRIRKLRSRRNRSPRVRPGLSPVQPRIWIMTFTRGIAACYLQLTRRPRDLSRCRVCQVPNHAARNGHPPSVLRQRLLPSAPIRLPEKIRSFSTRCSSFE